MLELEVFKSRLIRSGRRYRTISLYLSLLDRLKRNVTPLDLPHIEQYFIDLKESGRKATYINGYIDALNVYGDLMEIPGYERIKYFKQEEHMKSTMSDDEIEKFLALPASRNGEKEKANYAVWTLFFSICAFSGMRPGEVAHLTIDTVDFGRGVFVLDQTKTHPRIVPIAPGIVKSLTDHIQSLSGQQLFPSRRGGKNRQNGVFDDVDWSYNFHSRLKRLNIKRKNLTPYSLRHSFITRLLEEDVALPKVQKIAGHRRIETTMHYTHLTTKDIITAIHKDPLSRKDLSNQERVNEGREALEQLGQTVVRAEIVDNGKVIYETLLG